MDKINKRIAENFKIVNQCNNLEEALLNIDGVVKVDFDLYGFLDNLHQVILLIGYDIPLSSPNYFEKRREMVNHIISTAAENDLTRTEDRIEDYGEHFYFVFRHGKKWMCKN